MLSRRDISLLLNSRDADAPQSVTGFPQSNVMMMQAGLPAIDAASSTASSAEGEAYVMTTLADGAVSLESGLIKVYNPWTSPILPERIFSAYVVDELAIVAEPQRSFVCFTPAGGIPARASAVISSASCDIYEVDVVGAVTSLVDSTIDLDVFNFSETAIGGSVYITAKYYDGIFIADAEDCPAS